MESKNDKTERYLGYLLNKREEFISKLVRVGAKLVNMNDDYDLDAFIKTFVPSSNFLKKKIFEEAKDSQLSLVTEPKFEEKEKKSCDDDLIEALRNQYMDFEKDFNELRKITEPETDDEAESEPVKPKRPEPKLPKKSPKPDDGEIAADSHYLTQVINPGEMSKIFVQKSRVDVVRSLLDEPNFDDDNLETIYIYRSKKC